MPDALALVAFGDALIKKFGSPDDSQHWGMNDWWYYIWKDPAIHPAGNFLKMLTSNGKAFFDTDTAYPGTNNMLTLSQKIDLCRKKMSGFGSEYLNSFDSVISMLGITPKSPGQIPDTENHFPPNGGNKPDFGTQAGKIPVLAVAAVIAVLIYLFRKVF